MNNKEFLGKRLREIRKSRGYTQDGIAEIANIEPQSISKIESGKNFPLLSNLEKIAQKLGIGLDDFFDFKHKKTDAEKKKEILAIYDNLNEKDRERLYRIARMLYL